MAIQFVIERRLRYIENGAEQQALLRIEGIERIEAKVGIAESWCCYYSIDPLYPKRHGISCADPLQALAECLSLIKGIFEDLERNGNPVWWLTRGDVGGFDLERPQRNGRQHGA